FQIRLADSQRIIHVGPNPRRAGIALAMIDRPLWVQLRRRHTPAIEPGRMRVLVTAPVRIRIGPIRGGKEKPVLPMGIPAAAQVLDVFDWTMAAGQGMPVLVEGQCGTLSVRLIVCKSNERRQGSRPAVVGLVAEGAGQRAQEKSVHK